MDSSKEIFNVFLPSNVKGATESFISHYTTTIASPINLNPNEIYEVGLSQLIYPTTALNCYDASMAFFSFTFGFEMPLTIPIGYYATAELLIQEIGRLMGSDKDNYKLSVDSSSHVIILDLVGDGVTVPVIKFSKNLQVLLGFPDVVQQTGFLAGKPFDLSGGIGSMYIYCNISNYSNVGSTTSPLLAVVPYSNTSITSFGEHQSYEPRKILYHLLSTYSLSEIQIEIRTKFGEYLPFATGEVLAVLQVRRRGIKL